MPKTRKSKRTKGTTKTPNHWTRGKSTDTLLTIAVILLSICVLTSAQLVISGINFATLLVPIISGVLFVAYARKIVRRRDFKLEWRIGNWHRIYYSPLTFILIALVSCILIPNIGVLAANFTRSSSGLSPYSPEGFSTLGVTFIAMGLFVINIIYISIVTILGTLPMRLNLGRHNKKVLFNVGVVLWVLSVLIYTYALYALITGAPDQGYPAWQF